MEFKPDKAEEILTKRQHQLLKKKGKAQSFNKGERLGNSPLAQRLRLLKEQAQNPS